MRRGLVVFLWWFLALAVVLVGLACLTLPPDDLPICSWQPDVVCRPPGMAVLLGARDVAWEARELCPEKTDLVHRSCYLRAGKRGSREVYIYRESQP